MSERQTHTKGPWKVNKSTGELGEFQVDSDDYYICETICGLGEEEANARLIAAAPELLAIVQKYLDSAANPLGMAELADIDAEARVIVAKAKGEA